MNYDLQSKSWIEENKSDLLDKLRHGLLPHALLLYGAHLSGQEELGEWLSNTLICDTNQNGRAFCGECKSCHLLKGNSHPDIQQINQHDKNIGVDVIRQASDFLQKTAQISQSKVVIIYSVELLTESAANALLKTLEEPTQNSYLLLVCNDIDSLLPTILSRCSQIKVKAPSGAALAQLMNDQQIVTPFSNINQFAELTDPDVKQGYIEFQQIFLQWCAQFEDSTELSHALVNNPFAMRWLVNCFVQLFRMASGWDGLLQDHELHKIKDNFSLEQLWQCITFLNSANKQLKRLTQANKTFTIEALLIDIEQILS